MMVSPLLLRPVERQTFVTESFSIELHRVGLEDFLIWVMGVSILGN